MVTSVQGPHVPGRREVRTEWATRRWEGQMWAGVRTGSGTTRSLGGGRAGSPWFTEGAFLWWLSLSCEWHVHRSKGTPSVVLGRVSQTGRFLGPPLTCCSCIGVLRDPRGLVCSQRFRSLGLGHHGNSHFLLLCPQLLPRPPGSWCLTVLPSSGWVWFRCYTL